MVTNNDAVQFLLNSKNNNARQERPRHLKYLNEFRTQQCLLFLEQQCQFHRPYTCFHWHFPNQKRRRPFKRLDGTFNYNPDVYCDKYDETSGSCIDGDDCPYAHRNAGDTERRYHPRYFKTGNCIYETTDSGACVKNGLHCAFAHGPDDIRLPVYDIREIQDASLKFTINLPASLEKERVLSEDPKWNEMFHVLSCYKTESCKKPPRMCRQGYSCPFYHNGKDKRRAPDTWRYRSTPCPTVRPGDEWQDSSLCESGDVCPYCHTRTEQQFHPEIYKSTKCNDVINSGYCPRGPFCAFAHCDFELTSGRDFTTKLQQDRLSIGLHQFSMPGAPDLMQSRSTVNPNIAPTIPSVSMISQPANCAGSSNTLYQRNPCSMLPFLSGDGQGFKELAKRSPQLSSSMLPALMSSPLGQMGSPPGSGIAAGRGRRVGRCASPQHIGVWQSPVPGQTDRASYANNTPNTGTFHTPSSSLSPTGAVSQHQLQMAFYRQQTIMKDSGRHRSGSSISSEGATPSFLTGQDITSSSIVPGSTLSNTYTYPGRCGNHSVTSADVRSGNLSTAHSKAQQRPVRSTSRKQPIMQQHQQQFTMSSCNNSMFPNPAAAVQQSKQKSDSIQPGSMVDQNDFTHNRPITLSNETLPFLRGDIWTPIHPASVSESSSDQLSTSSWAWKLHADSGNNSETSITEVDVPNLFDFMSLSSSHQGASPFVSSTLMTSGSNRDSGLVMDFSLSASNQLSERFEPFSHQAHNEHASLVLESIGAVSRAPMGYIGDNLDRFPDSTAGFQSPLDDILLQNQSNFEDLVVHPNITPNARSSPMATLLESSPVAIPGHGYESLEPVSSSKRDRSFENPKAPLPCHQRGSAQSQIPARSGQQNTWPVSLSDLQEVSHTRHLTNLSSPINSQVSQSFSPVVGTPLSRSNQKPIFQLGGDAESASVNIARSRQVSAAVDLLANDESSGKFYKLVDSLDQSTSSPEELPSTCQIVANEQSSVTPCTMENIDFNNLPQSPNLLSLSLNDPLSERECLSLQKALDQTRELLDSKENEVESLRKQRDFVTEHLKSSLDVIRQLFDSLNVSSKDVSKPLFVDTSNGGGSGQSTGLGFIGSELSPICGGIDGEYDACHPQRTAQSEFEVAPPQLIGSDLSTQEKTQIQQQQEALAALYANPFVAALLKESVSTPSQWAPDSFSSVESPQSNLPARSVLYKLQHPTMATQVTEREPE